MKKNFISAALFAASMALVSLSANAVNVENASQVEVLSDADALDAEIIEELVAIFNDPVGAMIEYAATRSRGHRVDVEPTEVDIRKVEVYLYNNGLIAEKPRRKRVMFGGKKCVSSDHLDTFNCDAARKARREASKAEADNICKKQDAKRTTIFKPIKDEVVEVVTYRFFREVKVTSDRDLIARLDKNQIIHRMFKHLG